MRRIAGPMCMLQGSNVFRMQRDDVFLRLMLSCIQQLMVRQSNYIALLAAVSIWASLSIVPGSVYDGDHHHTLVS